MFVKDRGYHKGEHVEPYISRVQPSGTSSQLPMMRSDPWIVSVIIDEFTRECLTLHVAR
jgi:hypothetical protein